MNFWFQKFTKSLEIVIINYDTTIFDIFLFSSWTYHFPSWTLKSLSTPDTTPHKSILQTPSVQPSHPFTPLCSFTKIFPLHLWQSIQSEISRTVSFWHAGLDISRPAKSFDNIATIEYYLLFHKHFFHKKSVQCPLFSQKIPQNLFFCYIQSNPTTLKIIPQSFPQNKQDYKQPPMGMYKQNTPFDISILWY